MFKRFTPVTHSNIWTRPCGARSAARFIGTSVIGVMRQGPRSPSFSVLFAFFPHVPRFAAAASSFPSFSILSRPFPLLPFEKERRSRNRSSLSFSLSADTAWHLLHEFEVSRCRSSGPREFPRRQRNAPLISLSTGTPHSPSLPLVTRFRSFRLSAGRDGPPAFEHRASEPR